MQDTKRDRMREFVKWTDALLRSMELSLRVEDPDGLWRHTGYKQFARKYVQILGEVRKVVELPPILDAFDVERMPNIGDTLIFQQKSIFETVHANVAILKSYLEGQLGVVEDEVAGLRDFVEARLRSAMLREPEKERDVQDSIEQLMIGRGLMKGLDYDREVGRVKISAKEVVPDFVFPKLDLALEVKFLNSASRLKEAIDEINADVAAYSKRYRRLMFVVYDGPRARRDRVQARSRARRSYLGHRRQALGRREDAVSATARHATHGRCGAGGQRTNSPGYLVVVIV